LDEPIEIINGFIQFEQINAGTLAQIGPHDFPPRNLPAIWHYLAFGCWQCR